MSKIYSSNNAETLFPSEDESAMQAESSEIRKRKHSKTLKHSSKAVVSSSSSEDEAARPAESSEKKKKHAKSPQSSSSASKKKIKINPVPAKPHHATAAELFGSGSEDEKQSSSITPAPGKGGVWSLRNVSISVPRAVPSGDGQAAVLRCSYDLEGAQLYSIRWYRAETEFYRYVPRELPPSMVFPLPGASVDLTQSDHQQVRIVNLNRRLSGDYTCEVSADAPLFHTDIRTAPLTIVDAPFRAPQLTVSRDSYARGDVIRANCTVDEAYPAPNITWILDEHKIAETIPEPPSELDFTERGASSQLEITILETEQYKVGLTYTSASLGRVYRDYGYEPEPRKNVTTVRYTMVPPSSGQFELACVTTIFDIYARKSVSVSIREDAPHPASVTGEDSAGTVVSGSLCLAVCACALHLL